MPLRLLFPPIERLSADGAFEPVDGPPAGRSAPVILVARELCAFEYFTPPAGGDRAAAAALRARQAAPFVNAGQMVRRQGQGFAIWWWDLDAIRPALADRFAGAQPRLLPASLGQPPGEGWRIVRAAPGFEAQLWRDGVLRASAWRRQPFDEDAWSAFSRVQRDDEPVDEPPPPQTLPVVWTRVRSALGRDITLTDGLRLAAASAAAAMILASAFFIGQGLRLAQDTRRIVAARALTPTPARDRAEPPGAWRALVRRPDPALALARAIGVAKLYGATPTAWAADQGQVSLTLPYSALSSLNRIALELRDTGLFAEIRPTTDDESQVIDLRLTLAGTASPAE